MRYDFENELPLWTWLIRIQLDAVGSFIPDPLSLSIS